MKPHSKHGAVIVWGVVPIFFFFLSFCNGWFIVVSCESPRCLVVLRLKPGVSVSTTLWVCNILIGIEIVFKGPSLPLQHV